MHQVPQQKAPVTVLLVDDSPIALAVLQRVLATSSEIKVVGSARSGREALEMIPKCNPAVVCTDLHMPDMDGLELTKKILELYPRPVLVVSASTQPDDTYNVFRLLEAGAIDVIPKPVAGLDADYEQMGRELISKIKVLSGVFVFRRRTSEVHPASVTPAAASAGSPRIIVIGASTGGPQVLQQILAPLPADFPIPIICIQHIAHGFLDGFADWLRSHVRMKVMNAHEQEWPKGGVIYFPSEGRQLEIGSNGAFVIGGMEPVGGHTPSITVTMRSVAAYYKGGAVGILLTGMGNDGAEGMSAIVRAGGYTIAQSKESCTIFGMPKQAIDLGAARTVLSPDEIVTRLKIIARQAGSR